MHPAPSVILFTVSSGLGFGLMFWLGLGFGPSGPVAGPLTGLFALGFAGLGLLASTFHLGNPQRAIKAFSQWRSSWLSREGCVSVAVMLLFFAFVVDWWSTGERARLDGAIAAALAIAAVCCTAMIYAQLRSVPRWSNAMTLPMFVGAALAGGAIAAAFAGSLAGDPAPRGLGVALLAASAAVYAYRRHALNLTLAGAGSSPESATGLGGLGRVRLLESPHSQPNYLMTEMVFRVARKHAEKLAVLVVVFGLFAPLFLFIVFRDAAAYGFAPFLGPLGLALALVLHVGGMAASRWLFFAEAEHAVGLYYGQR